MEGRGIIVSLHGYVTTANCTWFGGSGTKTSGNYLSEHLGKEKVQCILLIWSFFSKHSLSVDCNSCFGVCLCTQWLTNPVGSIALTQGNWTIFKSSHMTNFWTILTAFIPSCKMHPWSVGNIEKTQRTAKTIPSHFKYSQHLMPYDQNMNNLAAPDFSICATKKQRQLCSMQP